VRHTVASQDKVCWSHLSYWAWNKGNHRYSWA